MLQQGVPLSDQGSSRHLCREDASILRVSHVPAQVVQDAPRHARVRSIAGQAEGVKICLGELPIVVQHLQAQQSQSRGQHSHLTSPCLTLSINARHDNCMAIVRYPGSYSHGKGTKAIKS